ncbi:MAG TPA: flagellar export protein FliJ [Bacillota bacterium]|nr:flagellar export protein FliJ [Bacillota bacterium]
MKQFKYSMESVLDYRKEIEQVRKQEFGELKKQYVVQKAVLDDLEKKLKNALYIQLDKTPVKLADLKSLQKYTIYLQDKIEKQEELVMEIETRMDQEREKLLAAQKDRKIVEKHKEKSLGKHNYKVYRTEQKANDEFALYSHLRK